MAGAVIKELGPQGRVSMPTRWRNEWKFRRLVMMKREKEIALIPIVVTPPSKLFDMIQISGNVDFTDPHSLKKSFAELHRR